MNLARRPLAETGQNGRSEENGSLLMISYEERRLQAEIELIQRKLIGSGEYNKLRDHLMKALYTGIWKHELLTICREAVKGKDPCPFNNLYNAVKEKAKEKVGRDLKDQMIDEVKKKFHSCEPDMDLQ